MTLPPNFHNIFWYGHYKPQGLIISGITDLYIVSDGEGGMDVHVYTWQFLSGKHYMGYFSGYYDDGDLVGIIDYADREEAYTLTKQPDGTIDVTINGKYDAGGVYAYTTTMEWNEAVSSLGPNYYIESYAAVWMNVDASTKISSISLGVVDANTLRATLYTHCGGGFCEWNEATAPFFPESTTFVFTNADGDTLTVVLTMNESGAVSAQWNLAYYGGGVAAGTQSLFKFVFRPI